MGTENRSPEEILQEAAEILDPAERAAYLEQACGGDETLRAEIESLLRAHQEAGTFLNSPALELQGILNASGCVEGPGAIIGRYKLLEQIGEGGMAVVYMAEQEHPIRRKVALKIIKLGMDTRQVIARFEVERQALALMDHPNIARVLDAGATETGRPYFVMELVRGIPITEYCDKSRLNTRQRLELFIQVCHAIQHAHQKGIIHRDIKPSNVLVTVRDGTPVPKVIDFGIAKATNQRLTEKTVFTRFAQMIGTPAYMSPEQAEMSELNVDTRTDVYSLGVLLYELLTGATPFDPDQLCQAGYAGIQRIIRETEPPKPSTKLSTLGQTLIVVAQYRQTAPETLSKLVRGDLDWIVMKALEKDRTRRYETPNELGMDIERHLSSRPVSAGAPTKSYRLQKFVRRHRIALTASLLIVAALVTAFVTTSIMWLRADKAGKRAVAALLQSQYSLYISNLRAAQSAIAHPVSAAARDYLNHCPEEFRHWEWRHLNWLTDRSIRTFRGHDYSVYLVAFGPDGRHIFSVGKDEPGISVTIKVCSADTGEQLLPLRGERPFGIRFGGALSPDGRRIVVCDSSGMKMYDAATGAELLRFERNSVGFRLPPPAITSIAFSPDGTRIVAASARALGSDGGPPRLDPESSLVGVFDVSSGNMLTTFTGHRESATSAVFSPDGQRIASGSLDKTIKVWDANTGAELLTLRGHESRVLSVAYSPDSKWIVSGSDDGTVRVWDASTGAGLRILRGHGREVCSVGFSPDGKRIVSCSGDTTVRLWDAATGEEQGILLGAANSAAFSPDGKYVVSGGCDGTIKLWDAERVEEPLVLRWDESPARALAFSPNSRLLVSGSDDGTVRIWNTDTGEAVLAFHGHERSVASVAFSPDGKSVVSRGGDKAVRLWDTNTGEELMSFKTEGGVGPVAFSPDGRRIVSGGWERIIRIRDAVTGTELAHSAGYGEYVSLLALTPDGKGALLRTHEHITLWDVETGKQIPWAPPRIPQPGFAISPDGKRIVSGIFDQTDKTTIELRDAATGEALLAFGRYEGRLEFSFTFSPDGERIVTGGWGEMIIWDATTGEELLSLGGHEGAIYCVAFSPNGRYIASSDENSTIRIWSCGPH
jgi:WD40 repeat protein/serine/threonine protein kinase